MKDNEKYVKKKLRDIESWIAASVGAANMIGISERMCTDGVIRMRDEAYKNVEKIVRQIVKRISK